MNEKNKLLRCPFCGGEACVTCCAESSLYREVSCKACGLHARWYHDNKEEAIEHWNARTSAESGILKQLTAIERDIANLTEKRKELNNELQEVQSRMKSGFVRDDCTM